MNYEYTVGDMVIVTVLIVVVIAEVLLVVFNKKTISERITYFHHLKSPFLCLLIAYLFFHWFAK